MGDQFACTYKSGRYLPFAGRRLQCELSPPGLNGDVGRLRRSALAIVLALPELDRALSQNRESWAALLLADAHDAYRELAPLVEAHKPQLLALCPSGYSVPGRPPGAAEYLTPWHVALDLAGRVLYCDPAVRRLGPDCGPLPEGRYRNVVRLWRTSRGHRWRLALTGDEARRLVLDIDRQSTALNAALPAGHPPGPTAPPAGRPIVYTPDGAAYGPLPGNLFAWGYIPPFSLTPDLWRVAMYLWPRVTLTKSASLQAALDDLDVPGEDTRQRVDNLRSKLSKLAGACGQNDVGLRYGIKGDFVVVKAWPAGGANPADPAAAPRE